MRKIMTFHGLSKVSRLLGCLLFVLCVFQPLHAQNKQIKIACIGNSITFGHGLEARFQNAYPGVLQQLLGGNYDVRNFGMNGRTLLQKGDYPYMREYIYRQAKEFQPDIVTIKLGTNDSKPHNWKHKKDFQKDMEKMIGELSALPSHPKIYICTPIPSTKEGYTTINDSTIVHGVIPELQKVSKRHHLTLIDLHTPLASHPEYLSDKIHPNNQGSAAIAAEIYKSITGKPAPKYDLNKAFPGKKSQWEGCDRYDFTLMGRHAIVVVPKKAANGRPWIWRPAFFGAFPMVDQALLKKGFHIAYLDVTHFYGSPRSVVWGNAFYRTMTQDFHLSPKVTVEGLSRGGYFALNWAAANPEKVACLYLDAPVCDITSWPGKSRASFWNGFLKEWNVTDAQPGAGFRGNAMALLPALAKAKVPIISVCGDSDQIVPFKENFKPFFDAYRQVGGNVELILKPGCDHHPHSLQKPEPVVDFILRHHRVYDNLKYIHRRGSLANSFSRFYKEKKGCVAFLGGSITFRKGWKEQIKASLQQRFPETEFTFIDAGIGSTGSTPHAFRFENDVLKKGTPDLLFFEAAVNDDSNHFTAEQQVRGMEGIVRHMLKVNPKADMVMLHFVVDQFFPLFKKGITPDVIMNHERVANWYQISSINLAQEINDRIARHEFTWQQFGGVHPNWEGSKNYAYTINRLFDMEIEQKAHLQNAKAHELPKALDQYAYENGTFIDVRQIQKSKKFEYVTDWMPKESMVNGKQVQLRPGFCHVPMLEATEAGASLRLEFDGKAIGIFCVCGPKAGILEYSIDGGKTQQLDMYTQWSSYLYLPWLYTFATELENGHHTLTLKLKKGKGEECQIRNFVVNR